MRKYESRGKEMGRGRQYLFLVQPKCSKEALAMLGLTAGLLFNKLQFSEWIMDFTFTIATQRVLTRVILNQMVFLCKYETCQLFTGVSFTERRRIQFLFYLCPSCSNHHTTHPPVLSLLKTSTGIIRIEKLLSLLSFV